MPEIWRGLIGAPENRCSPYSAADYPYSQQEPYPSLKGVPDDKATDGNASVGYAHRVY